MTIDSMFSVSWRVKVAAGGLVVAVALAIALAAAPLASAAEAPAWKITSYATPTNLAPSTNEVQAIAVKTSVSESVVGEISVSGKSSLVIFPGTGSAAEVQQALETELGAGNVEVSGGPGNAAGTNPYVVTFTGALAGEQVTSTFFTAGVTVEVRQTGGSGGELMATAVNVGGAATNGSQVTIRDTLPAGLVVTGISGVDTYASASWTWQPPPAVPLLPILPGAEMSCSARTLVCTRTGAIEPGDQLVVMIRVAVAPGAPSSVVNQASVSGGGAEQGASVSDPVNVSSTPASFGLVKGSVFAALSSDQAGAHANVTTGFALNTVAVNKSAEDPKDVRFDLPPGVVGNTVGMPRCTAALVTAGAKGIAQLCPVDTIVGVASTYHQAGSGASDAVDPIYDIEPSPGEPAAFMFVVAGIVPVRLDTSVLSDGDYAVRVTAGDLGQTEPVLSSYVTIWGVPADHQGPGNTYFAPHELSNESWAKTEVGGPSTSGAPAPLLTSTTQCSTPLIVHAEADSWRDPGVFTESEASLGSLTGCGSLPFGASMSMLPDTLEAGQPAGYSLDLHVPQTNEAESLAPSYVKKVVTVLPMGTVISPSAAQGLAACSTEAFFGSEHGSQQPAQPGDCPSASQVGTVQIETPSLALPLTGDVYLATPECDPCTAQDAQSGKMVRLFVQVVGEGESGIVVKLEGRASINQQTGQITATFENTPQLPFSEFKLQLTGGSRATLANPRTCGTATTSMGLTPWTAPFAAEISNSYSYEVNEDCITPRFDPSFVAGTTNIQAGEYSPFTVSFGRTDQEEFFDGVQIQMPPGLVGSLTGVPLCKEPQAAQGTCSEESLIGHTQVLTGPGSTPFLVTGGKVFLTEGYKGAPFGLSIVVPTVAGPYTLAGSTGKGTVVVRAAVNVNSETAALTITSDPLPTEFDGIPLQLKVVNVTVDRPRFTLNPTNCSKLSITGVLSSVESGGASVASPYQATNCAALGFTPKLTASTASKTSRADGASLDVKVAYPQGSQGTEANIARVKVELPKRLPSRLSTLQKACVAKVFMTNPGGCPAASVVGIAKVDTPILPVELTGPVYFVSNGGEAFPNLIIVLQGYGVRVDLVGSTFISTAGITSTTFKAVPDVPFNSFELYLPQGPDSALAANGDLCKSSLDMPTELVAQNGAEIKQDTKIQVGGCAPVKPALKFDSHTVAGDAATIVATVPSAGRLVGSGKGLTKASKSTAKARKVTLQLALSKQQAALIASHPGKAPKLEVKLVFTPKSGAKLTKTVTVSFAHAKAKKARAASQLGSARGDRRSK